MSSYDQTRQQFTEKQIGAILKRAAELQSTHYDAGPAIGPQAELSLPQVQQAAAELGFNPHLNGEAITPKADSPNTSTGDLRTYFLG